MRENCLLRSSGETPLLVNSWPPQDGRVTVTRLSLRRGHGYYIWHRNMAAAQALPRVQNTRLQRLRIFVEEREDFLHGLVWETLHQPGPDLAMWGPWAPTYEEALKRQNKVRDLRQILK